MNWRLQTFLNGLYDDLAYRAEFLIQIIGSAFIPVCMQLILWRAMQQPELISYTLISLLFTQIRGGDLDFTIQEMIRTGSLSQMLLRPVSVLEFIYLRGSASRFLIAGIASFIGLFFLPAQNLLCAMLLALCGNLIHYQVSALCSIAAFYWEEAYSLLMVKNMCVSFLSGDMLPLSLLTTTLWQFLPFYLYVYEPVLIAQGKLSALQILTDFALAGAWILGLSFLIHICWRQGLKRYQSIGG